MRNYIHPDEREEIFIGILDLASEGMKASEIADILNISVRTVYYVCDKSGVPFRKKVDVTQRAMTQEEYEHFRRLRKKGISLRELEKVLKINRRFLAKIEKKKQTKIECRDCHKRIKIKKGTKRCPECGRKHESDRTVNKKYRKYKTDPIFRKKEVIRLYGFEKKRKGLT